jgi:molybdopterin-binding protein
LRSGRFGHRVSQCYSLDCWLTREENEMQLSTRNRLPGTITEVVKGEAAAKVTIQVGDNHMVALITRESADELGLEAGKEATALVKATDVMILTEDGGVA